SLQLSAVVGRAGVDAQRDFVLCKLLHSAVAGRVGCLPPITERQDSIGGRDDEARRCRRLITEVDRDLSSPWRPRLALRRGERGQHRIAAGGYVPALFEMTNVFEPAPIIRLKNELVAGGKV